ncbi:Condensation domain-containing protein [Micromonospora phaseoli]|uniref:Condensation domain-containing protein n=1 Tax=Micromonospora phaseoli TaxID=1144548 RepID=A0A1H6Z726_9ACTN|nr:condensation domain-containing protein [Micromonospora phaseoli]PZW00454.1 condensation domain-containing protein [Micromonospora phaseoli]GIJ76934.1 hypothetical protein Xph01_13660 [Micromonospora phaseoli]SEJ45350.1 Condensation domain-containing protein [Micromonospora phaseoli]
MVTVEVLMRERIQGLRTQVARLDGGQFVDGAHRQAPLCWGQRWSWHEQQLPAGQRSPGLHLVRLVELPDGARTDDVRAALQLLVTRHTVLRSTFAVPASGGVPLQTVWPAEDARYELGAFDDAAHARTWSQGRDLDIAAQWPLRAAVGPVRPGVLGVLLVVHHIAADQYAFDLLCAELLDAVRAAVRQLCLPLPPADRQPVELANFEQSTVGVQVTERALGHWLRHDDDLGESLTRLRAGAGPPSGQLHLTRVVVDGGASRLAELGAATQASAVAVAVAAVACTLARHLDREVVPMTMRIANRHRPGYARSVSSLAQSGLLVVPVTDPGDLAGVAPAAWSATLHAMRHAYYDGDELSERMPALDSGRRHATVVPPSVNVVPVDELPPAPVPRLSTGDGPAVWAGQVDSPCLGLDFHVGIGASGLAIELRAGTHLVAGDDAVGLVREAMALILGERHAVAALR